MLSCVNKQIVDTSNLGMLHQKIFGMSNKFCFTPYPTSGAPPIVLDKSKQSFYLQLTFLIFRSMDLS